MTRRYPSLLEEHCRLTGQDIVLVRQRLRLLRLAHAGARCDALVPESPAAPPPAAPDVSDAVRAALAAELPAALKALQGARP